MRPGVLELGLIDGENGWKVSKQDLRN